MSATNGAAPVANPYFSVSDIADVTGVDRQFIYRAMYRGELVPIQRPGRLRFTAEEVNRWWGLVKQLKQVCTYD